MCESRPEPNNGFNPAGTKVRATTTRDRNIAQATRHLPKRKQIEK